MRTIDSSLGLRVGEWVEVRSAEEILATLDEGQCVDGLPFMPEMLQHCGKIFRVFKSAHKTADTIELFSIRRMKNAVHLEKLRCDGGSHGGCQAGCLLFWKECWLKRVPGGRGDFGIGNDENTQPRRAILPSMSKDFSKQRSVACPGRQSPALSLSGD